MKQIAFQNEGSLSVVIPVDLSLTFEEIAAKTVPEGIPFTIIEDSEVDHEFFGAYEHDGKAVSLNIEKAKEIQLNKWREARKPKMASLDIDYMKALETSDSIAQEVVQGKKQGLRDVTKIVLPDTLEGIKAEWPACLN